MKSCPYCAEEIQDKAIICRYCNRYVMGVRFRRIFRRTITIVIITALVLFVTTHRAEIRQNIDKVRLSFYNLGAQWKAFIEDMKLTMDGLKAFRKYRRLDDQGELIEELKKGDAEKQPPKGFEDESKTIYKKQF